MKRDISRNLQNCFLFKSLNEEVGIIYFKYKILMACSFNLDKFWPQCFKTIKNIKT